MLTKLTFCKRLVFLKGEPISFTGRPYLPAIYAARGNLVLRCSRQTEKSTFLVNTILYEACTRPGIQILFVCPRIEQARVFSRSRLLQSLDESRLIRRTLLGPRGKRPQVTQMLFANGSGMFVRAAYHSGDSCRGLSADLLLVDEFQDIAEGDLPVLQETLSHAQNGRTILTGTPKSVDNHLEVMFRKSTAHEWTIDCSGCGRGVILDERTIGPVGIICPTCSAAINPAAGRWIARNPHATWGDGFCVSHPMVPWLAYDDILERQSTYDLVKFKNEVLGLSTTTGDSIVTRGELEACCVEHPMASSLEDIPARSRTNLIAGIDWGGGGTSRTVLVIGQMRSDFVFQVWRFERFVATEDPNCVLEAVAELCRRFAVQYIAADGGGNGHVYNRLLLERLKGHVGFYALVYSTGDREPHQEGVLTKWTINRSASIGNVFNRVKRRTMLFPSVQDSGSFLEDFAAEVAEYDSDMRSIRYTHPETQPDDALHATNYAVQVAARVHYAAQRFAG